jgi:hypothetical protein
MCHPTLINYFHEQILGQTVLNVYNPYLRRYIVWEGLFLYFRKTHKMFYGGCRIRSIPFHARFVEELI